MKLAPSLLFWSYVVFRSDDLSLSNAESSADYWVKKNHSGRSLEHALMEHDKILTDIQGIDDWISIIDILPKRYIINSSFWSMRFLQAYTNWLESKVKRTKVKDLLVADVSLPVPDSRDTIEEKLDKHWETWRWFMKQYFKPGSFKLKNKKTGENLTLSAEQQKLFTIKLVKYMIQAIELVYETDSAESKYDSGEVTELLEEVGMPDPNISKAVNSMLHFNVTDDEFSTLIDKKVWTLPKPQ